MKNLRHICSWLIVISCAVGLSACGGGGGGSNKSSSISSQSSSAVSISSNSSSSLSNSSTSLTTSSSSSVSSANGITSVTIHYKRLADDYTGWGLHLWNADTLAAIAAETVTTWPTVRPFDGVVNGWDVVVVPIINPAANFNFIVHKGEIKSPTNDLFFVPATSGENVWVVQDNNTLFFSETEANFAVTNPGEASTVLDLSDVAPVSTNSTLPVGWNRSANFMEIFVRSYKDSDGNGKGDIQGLISKLDYLQSLGITGIWLMPMMESSDNDHGYSVIDYRAIESDYGTMEDFEELLTEAHARGIGIVLDYVMNHSSYANPLFIDASYEKTNDKHDWYIFSDTNPGWTSWSGASWHSTVTGFFYGVFTEGLPDFNLHNSVVVNYHMNNLRFWLNKGVDGFRFDAAGVLFENGANAWSDQPENHVLMAEAQAVITSYDNRFMICEAPDAPAQYAVSTSCVNAFAFGYQGAIKSTATGRTLSSSLATLLKSSTKENMPLILSNHDSFAGNRPISELSRNNLGDYKVAAAITILASSTPFTYYGEEIGMANGVQGDDGKLRTPMSWTSDTTNAGFSTAAPYRSLSTNVSSRNVAVQDGVDGSLLEHYRALYTVRKNNPVLGTGALNFQSSSGNAHLIFTRTDGDNVAAVLINLSLTAKNLTVSTGVNSTDFIQKLPATDTVYTSNGAGSIMVNVPAQSAVVLVK